METLHKNNFTIRILLGGLLRKDELGKACNPSR